MITSHDLPLLQLLIQQLDLGYIKPSEAKDKVSLYTGHAVKGRTKEQVIKGISSLIMEARANKE